MPSNLDAQNLITNQFFLCSSHHPSPHTREPLHAGPESAALVGGGGRPSPAHPHPSPGRRRVGGSTRRRRHVQLRGQRQPGRVVQEGRPHGGGGRVGGGLAEGDPLGYQGEGLHSG